MHCIGHGTKNENRKTYTTLSGANFEKGFAGNTANLRFRFSAEVSSFYCSFLAWKLPRNGAWLHHLVSRNKPNVLEGYVLSFV